jgi:hypothetical protein
MLVAKREAFHSQIRAKQICLLAQKTRLLVTRTQQTEALEALIEGSQTLISKDQLALLIKYGLLGHQNAVIHLGNLLIDDAISDEELEELSNQDLENVLGERE